jgi:chorismate dehydratase
MSMYTVGCVSYVNAIPLVMRFEDLGEESPVRVLYDVPSKLPAMLEAGEAQAVLVSSIDALRIPGRRMAMGMCIGSDGPVKSVRLFSRVPPHEIRTLAHDASSLTSNRLAQVILAEAFDSRPVTQVLAPNLDEMLQAADACVLIGDIGMAADGTGLHVLDLGEEWRRLTGKPFVWAAWIGGEDLMSELAALLVEGSGSSYVGRILPGRGWRGALTGPVPQIWQLGFDRVPPEVAAVREGLVERARRHADWDPDVIRDYYMNVMVYDMDETMLDGLREFRSRLLANGFADCDQFPEIVYP